MRTDVDGAVVEAVFRQVHGQAIATLVRTFGDISIAEDAIQDAFVVASRRWKEGGVPANPAGWIITTARNRAIDVLRRDSRGRDLARKAAISDSRLISDVPAQDGPIPDDQLRLIFTCCHPALSTEHRVALTLRLIAGLSVTEIARLFLVSEAALAKRLVRAKSKIKVAKIPYRVPSDEDLPVRVRSVLSVLYLIYSSGADASDRRILRSNGIRLARSLVSLMPDELEAAGLLALMLLNESRMDARWVSDEAVLLRDQDRTSWDRAMIEEGQTIVRRCIEHGQPGSFQIQAAIQAVHCEARSFEETDWNQIVALYDHLLVFLPTPIVELNRSIAVGERDGPQAALDAIDEIGSSLDDFHLLHAARATMLRRIGSTGDAVRAFERALQLAPSEADRVFLKEQVRDLTQDSS